MRRPTVVSTFSGCGGSSLGYKMAGFRVLLAVDFDDNSMETYRANFPGTRTFHGDIKDLSVRKLLEICGLEAGELDVLDGSPPCQGFSMQGKRRMADSRNRLFMEYVRLLRGTRPRAFVMENVSGMVKGKMRVVFTEIFRELKASGYWVSAAVLNSMRYGVPQARERIIFVGTRNDLKTEPTFPRPTSRPISVTRALEGCPVDEEMVLPEGFLSEVLPRLRQGESPARYHPKGHHFSTRRNKSDMPSFTISRTFGKTLSGIIHPTEPRFHTISELKRLSSFPDDFVFVGTFTEKWNRIGNTVPPLFMRAIAEHVRRTILERRG